MSTTSLNLHPPAILSNYHQPKAKIPKNQRGLKDPKNLPNPNKNQSKNRSQITILPALNSHPPPPPPPRITHMLLVTMMMIRGLSLRAVRMIILMRNLNKRCTNRGKNNQISGNSFRGPVLDNHQDCCTRREHTTSISTRTTQTQ
jgi:hypothetical protein